MKSFRVRRGSDNGKHELFSSEDGWTWTVELWDGDHLLEAARPAETPDEFFDPASLIDRYR